MKKLDLENKRFGRLTAIKQVSAPSHVKPKRRHYLCKCDCGAVRVVSVSHLTSGHTKSCGCLSKEMASDRAKHGYYGTTEYASWYSMKKRCLNKNYKEYQYYGGRGINICERWLDFENFIQDMGKKPSPSHSLDRIDNAGNYEPRNCRWASKTKQGNNKRNNILITYKGETKTLAQWARLKGIKYGCLRWRYSRGWSVEKMFNKKGVNNE